MNPSVNDLSVREWLDISMANWFRCWWDRRSRSTYVHEGLWVLLFMKIYESFFLWRSMESFCLWRSMSPSVCEGLRVLLSVKVYESFCLWRSMSSSVCEGLWVRLSVYLDLLAVDILYEMGKKVDVFSFLLFKMSTLRKIVKGSWFKNYDLWFYLFFQNCCSHSQLWIRDC